MGKIGQNPKMGQIWRPVALQPYVVDKSWLNLGNCLALGLQRGVNSIFLQCIPWPVACSEWGACLTVFRSEILEKMTPKVKIFQKRLSGFFDGTPKYVSWPNLVKVSRCEVAKRVHGLPHKKNLRSAGLVPAPILPKMGQSRSNFHERCHPLTCPHIPNLVRISCA